jgi:hypothetical protein
MKINVAVAADRGLTLNTREQTPPGAVGTNMNILTIF